MEEIRRLREEDKEASMALSEFAFQYEVPAAEREERLRRMKPQETWGTFLNGELIAKATVLPLQTYIAGRAFAMGGVAGVATWPEHRRGGRIARILRTALEAMRADGQTVSFLHPFSFAFYRKFGWECYTGYKQYEVDVALLPKIADESGTMRRIAPDWQALQSVYEPYAIRYNGMLKRDEDWWTRSLFRRKKGQVALSSGADGRPNGYMIYQVKEQLMTIHEWVALNEEATRTMWRFTANHDSMIQKVRLTAPVDDPLTFRLDNPRIKQEVVPYFMARIVDLAGFAELYPFQPADRTASLQLEVHDSIAPWNDGSFTLAIGGDGQGALRPASGEAACDGKLETDIQTLSTLFLGYQPAETLFDMGRLRGDREAAMLLQSRLDTRTPYLTDFF